MLRSDHQVMISQTIDGASHWTVIKLADKQELFGGRMVQGTWRHTDKSHDESSIKFTSDNPQYLFWQWVGGPQGGLLQIGSRMGRASHKAGEDSIFQVLMTLSTVKRDANGYFHVPGSNGDGTGLLTYNVNPYFKSGAIEFSVIRYGG